MYYGFLWVYFLQVRLDFETFCLLGFAINEVWIYQVCFFCIQLVSPWTFPGGSDVKESACSEGDIGLIP